MIICGLTFSVLSFLWTLDHYFHDWLPPYCTTCPPSITAIRALWIAPPLQASRPQIILRTSLTAFIPHGPLAPPRRIILQTPKLPVSPRCCSPPDLSSCSYQFIVQ
ncbi:hypothetical protein AMECASPLE_012230 [Ameca splendens]|uniref:Secreted protein n=1 Tax=Ameca splendens TaxID=208324 RepID=A0ABV0XE33_9TELE